MSDPSPQAPFFDDVGTSQLAGNKASFRQSVWSLRTVLSAAALSAGLGWYAFYLYANRIQALAQSWKWTLVLFSSAGFAAGLLLIALAAWLGAGSRILSVAHAYRRRLKPIRGIGLLFFAGCLVLYPLILFSPFGKDIPERYFQASLLALLALIGAEGLKLAGPGRKWLFWGLVSLFTFGFFHRLLSIVPTVSNDPFSLGYSEASSYYYASTFFSRQVYGFRVPWPIVNPAYHLLESFPFLVQGLPIWVHRLWEGILWVILPLGAAAAAVRLLRVKGSLPRLLSVAWAFFFISLVPVYYHLLVGVIIVLLGFTSRKGWVRWAAVLLASAWAGICRINWFPMPGLLAATIYLLEEPMRGRTWRYLLLPAGWTAVGLATALLSYMGYIQLSGNLPAYFITVFNSELLWYRVLPSAENPFTVLVQVSFVSLPLWLMLAFHIRRRSAGWHWLRLTGLALIVVTFFIGGLVVSAKIGGGADMHNLDAYFLLLGLICAYTGMGKFHPDAPQGVTLRPVSGWVLAWILILPVLAVTLQRPIHMPAPRDSQAILTRLQHALDGRLAQDGDVLFIYHRQLLTFDQIHDIRLVPEYERITLMEMAMGDNRPYLERFYADLSQHRFSAIVIDPINTELRGSSGVFGEENDVWLIQVGQPILENYQVEEVDPSRLFAVLVPKPD